MWPSGLNDEPLNKISTKDLVDELINRDGVDVSIIRIGEEGILSVVTKGVLYQKNEYDTKWGIYGPARILVVRE